MKGKKNDVMFNNKIHTGVISEINPFILQKFGEKKKKTSKLPSEKKENSVAPFTDHTTVPCPPKLAGRVAMKAARDSDGGVRESDRFVLCV